MIKYLAADYIPNVVISKKLILLASHIITNIEEFNSPRLANPPIVLSQSMRRFKINNKIIISVFGAGCSIGAILLKKL